MKLIDSTLREGEQCFGVYFRPEQKADILERLCRLGVDELELGVAGRDESLAALLALARARDGAPPVSVWTACRRDAIETAAPLGADWLHMGLPVSAAHMRTRLKMEEDQLLEHLARHVALAGELGAARVSVGLEDASRADPDFLMRAALAAQSAGAARVRLSDTVGVWNPLSVAEAVARLKAGVNIAVGVHCHDDFGLGTGNALAGLLAGADYADCTVLGLGERAGLACTEELAAYLHLRLGRDYAVAELPGLCEAVALAAGIEISPRKAVAGTGQFACETGLHVHGIARDPALFEPYDPARLGLTRSTALGKKSGRAAVAAKLNEMGIDPAAVDVEKLVSRVREASERLGRPLTEQEARDILRAG
ncbi:LeuA family protein [Fundidesulfovibrio soli]|uniref:LeuA family protein n=1 Tax=Fundidesulfovibrio soli TaxID=2922716 RepID=UPI001FAFFBF4